VNEADIAATGPAIAAGIGKDPTGTREVRVILPGHLRSLAKVTGEVRVDAAEPVTIGTVLDAIEQRYPVLRGAIRDHDAGPRRPFVRYFACEQDLSHDPPETPVPGPVADGTEPFLVVGSISGG
jgi:hypothetical protein